MRGTTRVIEIHDHVATYEIEAGRCLERTRSGQRTVTPYYALQQAALWRSQARPVTPRWLYLVYAAVTVSGSIVATFLLSHIFG
ncbi:MAG TPA: hypothetical protein VKP65_13425 [Rhodothermales bacterium]|nr:hypothetical protein [Rhodothermales bacterium]